MKALAVGAALKELRLKAVRKNAELTQQHVSHESQTSPRHFQKIESGEVDVRLSTLFAISEVLGVTPKDVLNRADILWRCAWRPKPKRK